MLEFDCRGCAELWAPTMKLLSIINTNLADIGKIMEHEDMLNIFLLFVFIVFVWAGLRV